MIPDKPLDHGSDWKCTTCDKIYVKDDILEMEKFGKMIVASIEEKRKIVDAVEELEKFFAPNYHLILVLKLKFISTQFKERFLDEKKVEYCQEILPVLHKLEGGHSPAIAQAAKELSRTQGPIMPKLILPKLILPKLILTSFK